MLPENMPLEAHIKDCMEQLKETAKTSYGTHVQIYARLRLADFSDVLVEWSQPNSLPNASPIPKVADFLSSKLFQSNTEQGKKLVAFLQQRAKQGQRTAMLYLAYLLAKGRFVTQAPYRAMEIAYKLSEKGDWRATRFWAEMLLQAPQLTEIVLQDEVMTKAKIWYEQYSHLLTEQQLEQSVKRFCVADSVVKLTIRRAFERAIEQGSCTAAKRLKGLTVLGELPVALPAKQFQSIEGWLNMQFASHCQDDVDDDDITVLPENVPLILQVDEQEEQAAWIKPATYVCVLIIVVWVFAFLLKMVMKTA